MATEFPFDVFIGHSSKDALVVRELAARLQRDGIRVWLDEEQIYPGDNIPEKVEEALEHSRVFVLCLSANVSGVDLAQLEARTSRFRDPLNKEQRFIPLLLDDAPIKSSLAQYKYIDWHRANREEEYAKLLYACLPPKDGRRTSSAKDHYDISRIVSNAPTELVGREKEFKLLNETWAKVQNREKGHPHILTFIAPSGEGKTYLVAKWAARLATQNWLDCDAAFAWSFYREGKFATSDLFLTQALTFFAPGEKDKEFAISNASAYEKGKRLAELVGERRTLIILDGIEALQYAPTAPTPGGIKDQGISALLKGLAAISSGLCIVTTRYSLPDLKAFGQTTATEVKLVGLSRDAGVHLLQTLGVHGTERDIEMIVEDMKGHALALTLLGGYLRDAHAGDIRKRALVKLEGAKNRGDPAYRIVGTYMSWLWNEGRQGRESLALLRLLGLSEDTVTADDLDELQRSPAIPGLTEELVGIDEIRLNAALGRLESAQLINVRRIAGEFISFYAHPVIRVHITTQLRRENPKGIQVALNRLHFRKTELNTRATPLRLYFESGLFTVEEIAELLGYFSDYYEQVTGDRLIIDSSGSLEPSGILVPQEA